MKYENMIPTNNTKNETENNTKTSTFENYIDHLTSENRRLKQEVKYWQDRCVSLLVRDFENGTTDEAEETDSVDIEIEEDSVLPLAPWFVETGRALRDLRGQLKDDDEEKDADSTPAPVSAASTGSTASAVTWGAMCNDLKISRAYANRLINAAETYDVLKASGIDEDDLPIYEYQVRPITRYRHDPELLKHLWEEALGMCWEKPSASWEEADSLPGADIVQHVVNKFRFFGRRGNASSRP